MTRSQVFFLSFCTKITHYSPSSCRDILFGYFQRKTYTASIALYTHVYSMYYPWCLAKAYRALSEPGHTGVRNPLFLPHLVVR